MDSEKHTFFKHGFFWGTIITLLIISVAIMPFLFSKYDVVHHGHSAYDTEKDNVIPLYVEVEK